MSGLGETMSDLKARFVKYLSNHEKFGKTKGIAFIRDLETFQGNLTSIQKETKAGNKEHLSNEKHFNFVVLFFVVLLFAFFSVVFLYLMRKKKRGGAKDE
jgi:ATP-dependent Zn protease